MATTAILAALLAAPFSAQAAGPVLVVEGHYEGSVSENGGLVDTVPTIRADHGPICGYRIVNTHRGKVPFEVFMVDQETGTAQLKARHPLNCEERRTHVVSIVAVSCSGATSDSAEVHVTVKDVNEYIPEWSEEEYSATVEEGGAAGREVVRVTARDRDCSPTFGDICSYAITSPDQVFSVSQTGVISTTAPLSRAESGRHVVSVVATDCGGKESSPVLVTVTVTPACSTAWADVSTSMTYIPGTGPQPVFPAAQLSVCSSQCPVTQVETTITLQTESQGGRLACDRDTYSLASQRKMCGASNMAVDLLPPHSDSAGQQAGPVHEFDGVEAGTVVVPEAVMPHNLGQEFTISTWMRHEAARGTRDKHHKEHVLCVADDHRKSRHHTALFVRNCKLVLLHRRDYREDERNVFRPAEWRWAVPQVCDGEWHHYAVSMSPESGAQLYLDGEVWKPQQNNPEIIDDWPLHPAADLKTSLTVGGCWHGSDMKMRHVLKGQLAGLSVLAGRREHSEVLRCLVQCSESLQLPATALLEPGMEMVTNSHGTQVTIDGDSVENVNTLVKQVAYLNTKEFPAPGKRRLELSTRLRCEDGSRRLVPGAVSSVMVMAAPQPIVSVSGTENVSREYEDFKAGVKIFSDLNISISQRRSGGEGGAGAREERVEVEGCTVTVFPPLNPDHETIALPQLLMRNTAVAGSVASGGGSAQLRGADTAARYTELLRAVRYSNQKPAYYLNRQFKLVCSALNTRLASSEYIQTLTVVHPSPVLGAVRRVEARPAHLTSHAHSAELRPAQLVAGAEQRGAGHGPVLAVIAVCVCALVAVLAVGVIRLRAAHNSQLREEQEVEMAWDDAALNITVNPLEDATESRTLSRGHKLLEADMYQDSSDEEMFEESTDDEDEDEEEEGHHHRLEWDDGL